LKRLKIRHFAFEPLGGLSLMQTLQELMNEPLKSVLERESSALDALINYHHGRVVLFGAGNLGRRALAELRSINIEPLCFSDNNQERWGSAIDNCPVLPPTEAVERFGRDASFIVTIWNANHWFPETLAQLRGLGCSQVSCYSPVYWRFRSSFLPFLLNDLPHKVYEESENVLKAESLWSDQLSIDTYRSLIYWYATGDAAVLPERPKENSYFPADVFSLSPQEVLVDCGAFDGDTIRQLIDRAGTAFHAVHAIEADPVSLQKLEEWRNNSPTELQGKIHIHSCAVGYERTRVRFEVTGTVDSRMCSEGGIEVDCVPLDSLFDLSRCTMIKMDIEGAEYDAIRGAEGVIKRDRPILAICVYHAQNHVWRIPLLAQSMNPEYRFFLRTYEGDGFQTVMYAVPPARLLNS
jgi:FkbM family methyltransferase